MSIPIKPFFEQTFLFLLKLLRHLVIQTIVMLFVWVDVAIHETFIEHTTRTGKAVTVTNTKPTSANGCPGGKSSRKGWKPGQRRARKSMNRLARDARL